LTKKVFS